MSRLLIFLLLSVAALPAYAQEGNISTLGRFGMILPGVYVDELVVQQDSDTHVSGSFIMYNSESSAVGDIGYKILVLSPAPEQTVNELVGDSPQVFSISPADTFYALNPGERRSIEFEAAVPALPKGEYRLRIQLLTSNDRELGWGDETFSVTTDSPFLLVNPQSVQVDSFDPVDPNKTPRSSWGPLAGVNVDPGEAAVFTATVENTGITAQQAVPVLVRKRLLTSNADTERIRGVPITVQANSSTSFEFPVRAEETPGAHRYFLTFESGGKTVSSISEYRLVVRGASASIISAHLKQFSTEAGTSVRVDFAAVGPSDRETKVDGRIHVALVDDKGVVGETDSEIILDLNVVEGSASFDLKRTVEGVPKVQLSIYDESNGLLDEYTSAFTGIDVVKPSFTLFQKVAVGFVLLAGLLVVLVRYKMKKS